MGICESKKLKGEIGVEIKNQIKDELKQELKSDIKRKRKNVSKGEAKIEVLIEQKAININVIYKVTKAICKIIIKSKLWGIFHGTGFFMNFSKSLRCLVTNYHVINPNLDYKYIELEIHNKKMRLTINNSTTKFIERAKDIAMIEIKESDEIYSDVEFLD